MAKILKNETNCGHKVKPLSPINNKPSYTRRISGLAAEPTAASITKWRGIVTAVLDQKMVRLKFI